MTRRLSLLVLSSTIYATFCKILALNIFLPRDAMRKRGLCCGPVSVRPSVCVWHVRAFYSDRWRYRRTSLSARYPIILVFWFPKQIEPWLTPDWFQGRDTRRFKSKIANFPTPCILCSRWRGPPWNLVSAHGSEKIGMMGLREGRKCFQTDLAV